jgi:tRNA pseudouridine38-40 synthase
MPRYALLIDYDGSPFNGWQRQAAGQPSVQAAIEAALGKLEPGPHTIAAAGEPMPGCMRRGRWRIAI